MKIQELLNIKLKWYKNALNENIRLINTKMIISDLEEIKEKLEKDNIKETEKTIEFDNIILSKTSYEYLIKQFNELNYETMIKEISRYLCLDEKTSIKIYNFIKENINE